MCTRTITLLIILSFLIDQIVTYKVILSNLQGDSLCIAVDFSQQSHWTGLVSEMELIPATHADVTCNGCHMFPVTGPRYECTHCEDFDFCEACFRTKPKHRHNFNKITDPSEYLQAIFLHCYLSLLPQPCLPFEKHGMRKIHKTGWNKEM